MHEVALALQGFLQILEFENNRPLELDDERHESLHEAFKRVLGSGFYRCH